MCYKFPIMALVMVIGWSGVRDLRVSGQETSSPNPPLSASGSSLELLAFDILKDVHNRGADLYNQGDYAGCYRMYEGCLRTIQPFLFQQPQLQKTIADGIVLIAKQDGVKLQAFRLHELIEQVRAELKQILSTPKGTTAPKEPTPAKRPNPPNLDETVTKGLTETLPWPRERTTTEALPVKPRRPTEALSGRIRYRGQPVVNASVIITSMDTPAPKTFTTKLDADGRFRFKEALPLGKYAALIDEPGGMLPAKYGSHMTSGLRFELTPEPLVLDWNLSEP